MTTFTLPPIETLCEEDATHLKQIVPFINRGNEMVKVEPVVAYYCVYYALKIGISDGKKSKQANSYLGKLLDELDKFKKSISNANAEALSSDVVGQATVENFALKIFEKADSEDRNGVASKKTAISFLAAALFMEILAVFGDYEPHIIEKVKYSRWKAADITKALREGRKPNPGPPTENDETGNLSLNVTQSQQQQIQPPVQASLPPSVQQQFQSSPTKTSSVPFPLPQPVPSAPSSVPAYSSSSSRMILDPKIAEQAQKFCRFAISSLQYDDVAAALDNLEKAAQLLRPFNK